mmetsp:Transcript_34939/g.84395  ORF Transcript_34939/g.84395 Transcript_34939/m.84395 type:complete len:262 (-) Transcript_34939:779-1564(-)
MILSSITSIQSRTSGSLIFHTPWIHSASFPANSFLNSFLLSHNSFLFSFLSSYNSFLLLLNLFLFSGLSSYSWYDLFLNLFLFSLNSDSLTLSAPKLSVSFIWGTSIVSTTLTSRLDSFPILQLRESLALPAFVALLPLLRSPPVALVPLLQSVQIPFRLLTHSAKDKLSSFASPVFNTVFIFFLSNALSSVVLMGSSLLHLLLIPLTSLFVQPSFRVSFIEIASAISIQIPLLTASPDFPVALEAISLYICSNTDSVNIN